MVKVRAQGVRLSDWGELYSRGYRVRYTRGNRQSGLCGVRRVLSGESSEKLALVA